MDLKKLVFFRAKAEFDSYNAMVEADIDTKSEIETQRKRFCSVYQIIKEAELEDEYEVWRAEQR